MLSLQGVVEEAMRRHLAATRREAKLRQLYVPDIPPCRRVVSDDALSTRFPREPVHQCQYERGHHPDNVAPPDQYGFGIVGKCAGPDGDKSKQTGNSEAGKEANENEKALHISPMHGSTLSTPRTVSSYSDASL